MKRIMLVTVVAALACPGSAWADSGSISNVFSSGSEVFATYTSTSTTCSPSGYCGWFPYGVQSPASAPCTPHTENDGRLTYVGDGYGDPGLGLSEVDVASFLPALLPVKICLYTWRPNGGGPGIETLVAEYVHGAAPPPPPPAPAPAAPANTTESVVPIGIGEARDHLPSALKRRYGKRFTRRSGRLQRSCYRLSTQKVRCRVNWKYKQYRYAGSVTLWVDANENYVLRTSIRGKRASASATSLPSAEARFRASVAAAQEEPGR